MKKSLLFIFSLHFFLLANAQNPRLVKDLTPGTASTFRAPLDFLLPFEDKVLFFTEDSLSRFWVSDGTENGTLEVHALPVDEIIVDFNSEDDPDYFYINTYDTDSTRIYQFSKSDLGFTKIYSQRGRVQNSVYLNNAIYINDVRQDKLKKLELTDFSVSDVFEPGFFGIRAMGRYKDEVVMIADHPVDDGVYLFFSDGTQGGERAVKLLNQGSEFSRHHNFREVGDKVLFFYEGGGNPYQLWASDGTEAGTQSLVDLEDDPFEDINNTRGIIVWDNKLYFKGNSAGNGSGGGFLFVSDGTVGGTRKIDSNGDDFVPEYLTPFKNEVYFKVDDGGFFIFDVFKTNGTQSGTMEAIDASELGGGLSFGGDHMAAHKGGLFFAAWRSEYGFELWKSDGTTAGTEVFDFEPGGDNALSPRSMTSTDGYLFFTGSVDGTGRELYVFDPEEGGVNTNDLAFAGLTVFPNPATDFLAISGIASGDSFQYKIQDLSGKVFKTGTLSGDELDVSQLSKGFWLLSIKNKDAAQTVKFIKD